MTTECIVAVDVGNTAVKFAVKRGGQIIDHRVTIEQLDWQRDAIDWVMDQLKCDRALWRISSVHRRAAQELIASIRGSSPHKEASIELVDRSFIPMSILVDQPNRLGIDRLLSAYAAVQTIAAQDRKSGMVVVDAGSAITVDWVDGDGNFCGGAILPGLALQARSLATGTDALPQIDWSTTGPLTLPARNTRDAIYGGIVAGAAAAIDNLARRYFATADTPITNNSAKDNTATNTASFGPLVLTGGDMPTLSPHLAVTPICGEHLACQGLLQLPVRLHANTSSN